MVFRRVFIALLAFVLFFPQLGQAQELAASENREVIGTVTAVYDAVEGQTSLFVTGEDGAQYAVDPLLSHPEGLQYEVTPGNKVILQVITNIDGTETVYFVDVIRTKGLWLVFGIFVAVILGVGLFRGFRALLGFAFTLAMLFLVVFPRILAGADPVFTVVWTGILMLAVNIFFAHGFRRNAVLAFTSVSIGVVLAWIFGVVFVGIAKLSGLADEQSMFVFWDIGGIHAPVGLLLAGIILGAVGVLDDVAITQCETVAELKAANMSFGGRELFTRAMRIGRHHIASMVNTLMLAYAGASLPLFLLFLSDDTVSLSRFINTEAVAEEIVRTLAGTTALVLAVPITTALAAFAWSRVKKSEVEKFVQHEHQD